MNKLAEQFKNPNHEYTQFPFWFWNDELTKEKIEEQIISFYKRNIYGFIIHPRIGLPQSIPYLGEKYFSLVKYAVSLANEKNMQVILYDEGMYPSGSCHGEVVKKDATLAAKGLALYTEAEYDIHQEEVIEVLETFAKDEEFSLIAGKKSNKWYLVYAYSKGTIRGIHYGEDDGEKNAPKASDLLDLKATEMFISLTHEKYYDHLKEFFGKTIIGFFTDEPSIIGRSHVKPMIACKRSTLEKLHESYSWEEIITLFTPEKNESLNEVYTKTLYDDLAFNYYRPLMEWCENHQIALMGHPHSGNDMGILEYFTYPGQDMVWRFVAMEENNSLEGKESTAAKCSADSSRHQGKRKNSNEIFGCCGSKNAPWDLTLEQMQWYINWLFVRGVNVIVPHAFFYSIDGKRMEERPPDVGPNNLWWDEYGKFALYSNRLSYLFTDSVNQTDIAVLADKTYLPFEEVKALYEQQVEFNYLQKDDLFNKGQFTDGNFQIEQQSYHHLIICDFNLSEKEKIILKNSGLEIWDSSDKNQMSELIKKAKFKPTLLGKKLNDIRFTHLVKEGVDFYLFNNEGLNEVTFTWEKKGKLVLWDSLTGEIIQQTCKEITLAQAEMKIFTVDTLSGKKSPKLRPLAIDYSVTTQPFNLTELVSWTTKDPAYSGTVTYKFNMQLSEKVEKNIWFDFGKVADILIYEEKQKQVRYSSPYLIKVSPPKGQELELILEIKNSLTNQYDLNPRDSGIFGPVKAFVEENDNE